VSWEVLDVILDILPDWFSMIGTKTKLRDVEAFDLKGIGKLTKVVVMTLALSCYFSFLPLLRSPLLDPS